MAVEGTKFTTTAPDGDKVDVVVTKVIKNSYEIAMGDVTFDIEAIDSKKAKQAADEIFRCMLAIALKFNGSVSTSTEDIRKIG